MRKSHQRELLDTLGPGWTLEAVTGKSHFRFRHVSGAVYFTGRNPGSRRKLQNVAAAARRVVEATRRG